MNKTIYIITHRAISYYLVALFVFLNSYHSSGQDAIRGFKKLSCPEKRWVLFHPFISKGVYQISIESIEKVKELSKDSILDNDPNGGQLDAFRHAYWMARVTQKYGCRRARSLGKAHEKGNYRDFKKHRLEEGTIPDEPSSQMDFLNNDVGIQMGKDHLNATPLELTQKINEQILAGKLYILKKDSDKRFLKCNGEIILPEEINGKWVTPKCITKSN